MPFFYVSPDEREILSRTLLPLLQLQNNSWLSPQSINLRGESCAYLLSFVCIYSIAVKPTQTHICISICATRPLTLPRFVRWCTWTNRIFSVFKVSTSAFHFKIQAECHIVGHDTVESTQLTAVLGLSVWTITFRNTQHHSDKGCFYFLF